MLFLQDASARTDDVKAMEVLPKLSPIAPVKSAHAKDVAEPGDSIRMYSVEILWVNNSVDATMNFGAVTNTYTGNFNPKYAIWQEIDFHIFVSLEAFLNMKAMTLCITDLEWNMYMQ